MPRTTLCFAIAVLIFTAHRAARADSVSDVVAGAGLGGGQDMALCLLPGRAPGNQYVMAGGQGGLLAQRGAGHGDTATDDPADRYTRSPRRPGEGTPAGMLPARKGVSPRDGAAPSSAAFDRQSDSRAKPRPASIEPWLIIGAVVGGLALALGCVLLVRRLNRPRRAGPLPPAVFGLAKSQRAEPQAAPAATKSEGSRKAA